VPGQVREHPVDGLVDRVVPGGQRSRQPRAPRLRGGLPLRGPGRPGEPLAGAPGVRGQERLPE